MTRTPLTTAMAAGGLLLALAGAALVAGPALAGTAAPVAATQQPSTAPAATGATTPATTTSTPTGRHPQPGAACARVPAALARTSALVTRLEADASTRGSLAWLQARITAADAAGKKDLAAALRTRLSVRTSLLTVLPERTTWLTDLNGKVCSQLPAGSSPTATKAATK